MNKLNSRLNTTKEKICEQEYRFEEEIANKTQRHIEGNHRGRRKRQENIVSCPE
jgi:hypothetical protein